jgi:hypothetical protein
VNKTTRRDPVAADSERSKIDEKRRSPRPH